MEVEDENDFPDFDWVICEPAVHFSGMPLEFEVIAGGFNPFPQISGWFF